MLLCSNHTSMLGRPRAIRSISAAWSRASSVLGYTHKCVPRSMRSAGSLNHSRFHTASMRAIRVNPSVLPEPTPAESTCASWVGSLLCNRCSRFLRRTLLTQLESEKPNLVWRDFMLFDQVIGHDVQCFLDGFRPNRGRAGTEVLGGISFNSSAKSCCEMSRLGMRLSSISHSVAIMVGLPRRQYSYV